MYLLEKVRGPQRAMIETYKALEDAHNMLTCYVESRDAKFSSLFPPSPPTVSARSVLTFSKLSSCAYQFHSPNLSHYLRSLGKFSE